MRPDEADEAAWDQIQQGFVGPVKDFGSYSLSNEMPLKCGKQENGGEKHFKNLYF